MSDEKYKEPTLTALTECFDLKRSDLESILATKSTSQYEKLLKELTKDIPNVTVDSFDGLLVDYMKKSGATIIVRGLRAVTDFEYELQIAQTNHVEYPEAETIFLTTNLKYSYLSSSIVREFAAYGGDISNFVPPQFIDRIYEKYNIKK